MNRYQKLVWFLLILIVLLIVGRACPISSTLPISKNCGNIGIVGIWMGTLNASGVELRVVFNIQKKPNGSLIGTLDCIDQGVKGIPIDEGIFEQGKLHLEVKAALGTFDGRMKKDGSIIKGHWKQAQAVFPLVLKRVDKVPELRRPQEPQKPYPYDEEEVVYKNKKAGIKLAGTLTLPRSKGPFPAVLLITGSGPQDRDESMLGHKPFLVLADYLTRRGIAVLRVDDREIGGSTGNFSEATSVDFASDVLAGIEYLKDHKNINPVHIGLIGHSEGGLIAPMVAANSPDDVAFIVMMAGPGLIGEELLYLQDALFLKAEGASEKLVADCRALSAHTYSILKTEKNNVIAKKKILAIEKKAKAEFNEKEKKLLKVFDKGELGIRFMLSPWFRWYLTYDPKSSLTKVKCPVLAIIGELDLQVAPKENLQAIEKALKAGGNNRYVVKQLPKLNHFLQTAQTGKLSEYGKIEETISPVALELIADWILSGRMKSQRQFSRKGQK